MDQNVIEITGLKKRFDKSGFVLDLPRLAVREGYVTGFIGENGAGKTTTIKLVMDLLFPDEGAYRKYTASPAAPLPATVTFGIDRDGSVRRRILEAMQLPGNVSLPVFLIGDTFNRVVFESHGYTIGLGDRLLYTIHQL